MQVIYIITVETVDHISGCRCLSLSLSSCVFQQALYCKEVLMKQGLLKSLREKLVTVKTAAQFLRGFSDSHHKLGMNSCKGYSWGEIQSELSLHFSFISLVWVFLLLCRVWKGNQVRPFHCNLMGQQRPISSEHFWKSENHPLSLYFLSLLRASFLSLLLPSWLTKREISCCQRSHRSLSQSNYKTGYFLPSAKHISNRYCMTSSS